VDLGGIRKATRYVEKHLGIERLLLSPELQTDAGQLFVERYGDLINVSQSGQLAIKAVFEGHLRRVEWEKADVVAFFPFLQSYYGIDDRSIVIKPDVSFGKPALSAKGISTAVITDRFDAGESIPDLAEDYSASADEIQAAILYERAA